MSPPPLAPPKPKGKRAMDKFLEESKRCEIVPSTPFNMLMSHPEIRLNEKRDFHEVRKSRGTMDVD